MGAPRRAKAQVNCPAHLPSWPSPALPRLYHCSCATCLRGQVSSAVNLEEVKIT